MPTRPEEHDGTKRIKYNAIDPTRTKTKRASFISAFGSRWREARGKNREWLQALSRPYASDLEGRYRDFFTTISTNLVLEQTGQQQVQRGNHWTGTYVRTAYQKGLDLAARDLLAFDVPESVVNDATRFTASFHQDSVGQEYQTVYYRTEEHVSTGRKEVMDDVREAIHKDKSVSWMVDQTNADIRTSVQNHAKSIANTAIVRAVNEAALNSYEQAGVSEVGVAVETEASNERENYHDHSPTVRVNAAGEVEFVTAGDTRVCPICQSLEGRRIKISDVRGATQFMPPIHPNCRCRLVPTEMDIKTTGEQIEVPEGFTGGLRSDT